MKLFSLFLLLLVGFNFQVKAQQTFRASVSFNDQPRGDRAFRIAFWNTENFFDPFVDSTRNYNEFTPKGDRHWGWTKYKKKANGIARTLVAIGGWEPAAVIGLCEVEDQFVLEGITRYSMLGDGYQIVEQDSRDFRGIDVAALYRPDKFNLINYQYIRVIYPADTTFTTRDILHLCGILPNKDTLHIFFNHWPSRYRGEFASMPLRAAAANTLRASVDSVLSSNPHAHILIAGDFNDQPSDVSIRDHLHALPAKEISDSSQLVNLSASIQYKFGTYNFGGDWNVLDQFIVTQNLADSIQTTHVSAPYAHIFDAPWLLKENTYNNEVLNRTYQGPMYLGGYSDHLPIYLDLDLEHRKPVNGEDHDGF